MMAHKMYQAPSATDYVFLHASHLKLWIIVYIFIILSFGYSLITKL